MKFRSNRLYAVLAVLGLAVAVSTGARAAEDDTTELEPPELAEESQSETADQAGQGSDGSRILEAPTIRQRQEHGQTVTEYERRGSVYMMTVKPRVGPTQYWNDPDGDGQFQRSTSDELDENVNLPKWRLGGW